MNTEVLVEESRTRSMCLIHSRGVDACVSLQGVGELAPKRN